MLKKLLKWLIEANVNPTGDPKQSTLNEEEKREKDEWIKKYYDEKGKNDDSKNS